MTQSMVPSVKKLSFLIPIFNEEKLLPRVLASARRLDCDIFILDSGSTDRSIEIAKSFGCHIHQGKWGSFSEKMNWGLSNLLFSTPWVMRLDADEYLTDEFVKKIDTILSTTSEGVNGIYVRRRIVFMGRWIRHGGMYPFEHLRITRVGHAQYESRLMDEHVNIDGSTLSIPIDICDEESKGLASWSRKHIGYAETECFIRYKSITNERTWASLTGTARARRFMKEELYARLPLFFRPFAYWGYRYWIKLGFIDGLPGFIYHFLHAFWYRFLIDSLIYEGKLTKGTSVKEQHIV